MWAVWEPWSALLDSAFHPKSIFAHELRAASHLPAIKPDPPASHVSNSASGTVMVVRGTYGGVAIIPVSSIFDISQDI